MILEIVDYDLFEVGVFYNCCIVVIDKCFFKYVYKVMNVIWGVVFMVSVMVLLCMLVELEWCCRLKIVDWMLWMIWLRFLMVLMMCCSIMGGMS